MRKTQFAGLTVLDEDESVVDDGGAFIGRDRDTIDFYLQRGAKTHRHNGTDGLSNPEGAPSGAIIASAGTLPADTTYTIGFTLEDSGNGETILSPTVTVATPPPMDQPENTLVAVVDHDDGLLLSDTYYYAISYVDDEGGETPVGPSTPAEVEPGFPESEVLLSGLTAGMATASAAGWRLYRAVGGGDFGFLASGTSDTFMDDGSDSASCDITPIPDDINTTLSVNTLRIDIPDPSALGFSDATFINVYVSEDGTFEGDVFLDQYPIASAGQSPIYRSLDLDDAQPPDVSTSIGGANKIDPDTELIDWHWKRPVAASSALGSGELGDVRVTLDDMRLWGMPTDPSGNLADWEQLAEGPMGATGPTGPQGEQGPTGISGVGNVAASGEPGVHGAASAAVFAASGALRVHSESLGGGSAEVLYAPMGRVWASATAAALASGASAAIDLSGQAGGRLLKLSTNKRARIRVYGDAAAEAADRGRAIGTDPSGDHGVLLDYAMTAQASGGIGRVAPTVDAHNLDDPAANVLRLNITNYDATGDAVVAFLYIPTEVV